jgi:GNAT superfamily N-acetyltransferase
MASEAFQERLVRTAEVGFHRPNVQPAPAGRPLGRGARLQLHLGGQSPALGPRRSANLYAMVDYRLAAAPDLPSILPLLGEIMETHGVTPPDAADLDAIVSRILAAPDHLLLVADENGHLIGMCTLVFSLNTWSAAPACELQDLVVTPEHRRADVGRGLIEAAQEMAIARGCDRLFLLAEYWNLEAHAFYRSLGLAEKTCLYFERDLRTDLL